MPSKTVSLRRLSAAGSLAIVAATCVNLAISLLAKTWFPISPAFGPIGIVPVIFWSVVLGIGAISVFALVARSSRRPVAVYVIIATCVYVLTFIPDAILLSRNPPLFPGTSVYGVLALMTMHAAEAIIMLITVILMGFAASRERKLKKTS